MAAYSDFGEVSKAYMEAYQAADVYALQSMIWDLGDAGEPFQSRLDALKVEVDAAMARQVEANEAMNAAALTPDAAQMPTTRSCRPSRARTRLPPRLPPTGRRSTCSAASPTRSTRSPTGGAAQRYLPQPTPPASSSRTRRVIPSSGDSSCLPRCSTP
jgi:hypothetical protein